MEYFIKLAVEGDCAPLIEYMLKKHPKNALRFGGMPIIYFAEEIEQDLSLPNNHPNKELLLGMFKGYLEQRYTLEILKDN